VVAAVVCAVDEDEVNLGIVVVVVVVVVLLFGCWVLGMLGRWSVDWE
jgi:hypothetical protein